MPTRSSPKTSSICGTVIAPPNRAAVSISHMLPSAPSLISVWVPQSRSPRASTARRASSTTRSRASAASGAGVMPARSVNGSTVGIRPLTQTGWKTPSATTPSTLT
ncbi:hypothetical protein SALBM135S_00563 [Streptomyces alboniger]